MSKNSIIDQQEDDRHFGTNTRRAIMIMTSVLEDKMNKEFHELWVKPETYGYLYIKPRQVGRFIPFNEL